MPFHREYDPPTGSTVINRTRTGPPKAPDTGIGINVGGDVIGDSLTTYDAISPSTPIPVTMPGPREKVIDAQGNMTPRWRRFFEELYRRTGAYEDNINDIFRDTGNLTPDALAITGVTPVVSIT